MEKKIVVCIGTDRASNVRARLSLMLMSGDRVLVEHLHSVNIEDGDPLDEVRKRVEAHLAMEEKDSSIPLAPWPPIPDAEWAKVVRVCEVIQPGRSASAAVE